VNSTELPADEITPCPWLPYLDDRGVIAIVTTSSAETTPADPLALVEYLRKGLSPRFQASVVLALLMRRHYNLPLLPLLLIARDLLDPESVETCENLVGVARGGWSDGAGELLTVARLV
jgi:hypothetical protein